jgi:hypothetical protein
MYKTLSRIETSACSVGEVELLKDLEARLHFDLLAMAKDVRQKGTQSHIEFMKTIKEAKPSISTSNSMYKTLSRMETSACSVGEVELLKDLEARLHFDLLAMAKDVRQEGTKSHIEFMKTIKEAKPSMPTSDSMYKTLSRMETSACSVGEVELLKNLEERVYTHTHTRKYTCYSTPSLTHPTLFFSLGHRRRPIL